MISYVPGVAIFTAEALTIASVTSIAPSSLSKMEMYVFQSGAVEPAPNVICLSATLVTIGSSSSIVKR